MCESARVAPLFVVAEEGVNEHQKAKIFFSDFSMKTFGGTEKNHLCID